MEKQVHNQGISFALKPYNRVALDFVPATANNWFELQCLDGYIASGLLSHFNSSSPIPRGFRVAMDKLGKNKNIFINNADKSNTVVILNTSDYVNKMDVVLSDTTTYTKIENLPLKS